MKKSLIVIGIVLSFLLGSLTPGIVSNAAVSVNELQKQIKSLQAQLSNMKKLLASKDQDINYYKANAAKELKTSISYEGNAKSGSYQIGNTSVPSVIDFRGVKYTPVNLLGELVNIPVQEDLTRNAINLGTAPNGKYMSDILQPYYVGGYDYKSNIKMSIGGNSYNKGYTFNASSWNDNNKIVLNLNGKYKNISGKFGIDFSNSSDSHAKFSIIGDGNELWSYEENQGELPGDFNVDVVNVKKLEFVIKPLNMYSVKGVIANPIIR